MATGYDPLLDNAPELARTMAASVTQRIAFGERAGEKVRRIGSGFGYEGERPALTGPRCASVNGFSLHANTEIPAHRRDQLERLIRYTARGAVSLERLDGGCQWGPRVSCSPGRGPTAPPVSNSHRWNSWKSWPRSCPCRVSTSCATAAVWRRIARCERDHPDTAPAGCGRGGGEDGNPVLALGQAPGARVSSGYGHVSSATVWAEGRPSLVPPWLTPDHCRHHPGVGDHAHLASSQAGVRPTSDCPCPLSPRNLRVRLSPRPVAWSRRRRARSGGVFHPFAP